MKIEYQKASEEVRKEIVDSIEAFLNSGVPLSAVTRDRIISGYEANDELLVKAIDEATERTSAINKGNPKVCCEYILSGPRYIRIRRKACESIKGMVVDDSKCGDNSSDGGKGKGGRRGGSSIGGWLRDICNKVPCHIKILGPDGTKESISCQDVEDYHEVVELDITLTSTELKK
ncbi:hypothetical protein [Rubellicoccus peritrichatus]|uniref:Uncharacterized protein n=1 Tax=Rubellicoccus peritrichatus TaxID=3080537 RepID=A0AAQ3QU58_9BACT|nr:hypothetical protein [Puniceicoccus sp. CR14]WOO39645.1 hypothetical protein RZN69_13560 [Puniceicoccus sp. CR14]